MAGRQEDFFTEDDLDAIFAVIDNILVGSHKLTRNTASVREYSVY